MTNLQEFSHSSNGDRWFLGTDEVTKKAFVLHRGNLPSGGHETKTPVRQFLDTRPFGPEREALLAMIGRENVHEDEGVGEDSPSA